MTVNRLLMPSVLMSSVLTPSVLMRLWGRCLLVASVTACLLLSVPVQAKERLTITLSQARLIHLPYPAQAVFISDPLIANFQAPSSNSVIVFGKRAGLTTLYALDEYDQPIYEADVEIVHDLPRLSQLLRKQYPDLDIDVSSYAGRLFVKGLVPDAATAEAIITLAETFSAPVADASTFKWTSSSGGSDSSDDSQSGAAGGTVNVSATVINQLTIAAPQQVNIRVRVAEISRTVSNRFGFRWGSMVNGTLVNGQVGLGYQIDWADANLGSLASVQGGQLTGMLDALATEGLVNVLAEPNLTALSGESASFLAGGNLPIPLVDNNGQATINNQEFGVRLDVTPTVTRGDRINLRIRPRVSELSTTNSVEIAGTRVPGVTTREADTTIELASGQSFALAGLLQSTENTNLAQMPYLADVPILGSLFRSDRFERRETELVIIATVYTVRPTSSRQYQLPQDGYQPYSDLERMLNGRILKPQRAAAGVELAPEAPRLLGENGFYY
ncbi:MAG: type II and III secretion system protein family protein [Marinobacterium sp.]|nr:type II and III secretion system protein family protein [Marinobacterium sp.]